MFNKYQKEELLTMEEFKNGNGKRVCDISQDRKRVIISRQGYDTQITANPDGTLNVRNLPKENDDSS